MGKVSNTPEFISQEDYDTKLNSDIDKLIGKGFSDEDIKLYGDDFKSRYAVKKKGNTTSASADTSLATSPTQSLPASDSQKSVDPNDYIPLGGEVPVAESSPLLIDKINSGEFDEDIALFKEQQKQERNRIDSLVSEHEKFISLSDEDLAKIEQQEKG